MAITVLAGACRLGGRQSSNVLVGPPRTILVIRLDLLGDVVFTLAGVSLLRRTYPHARIVMLTLPYTAPLARMYPMVDEVIEVDTNRIRTVRGLCNPGTWRSYLLAWRRVRSMHPDVALSVSGRMASLCAFLSGARQTIGYTGEAYPFTLTDSVPGGRYHERKHEVEYVAVLARRVGAAGDVAALPGPTVPEGDSVPRLLELCGSGTASRLILLHAGSVNGSAKRWLPEYWAVLGETLQAETDADVVLVGAGSDEPVAREVLARAPSLHSLVGRTTVEDLVSLVAAADLVITGDSGPLHLAVALQRPLLAVYGPTDPAVYGPFRPVAPTLVRRADLPCSPCYTLAAMADCPLGYPICMHLVRPQEMLMSARALLSGAAV